jgi:hypothetical protein
MKSITFYRYFHYNEIENIKQGGTPNLAGHKWYTKKAAKEDKSLFQEDYKNYKLAKVTVKIEEVK